MKNFVEGDKLSQIVHHNYALLPVLNRFGIRLGIKDKTINEVCEEHQLNTAFVLCILNTYHDPSYFPETELKAFSPLLIIDYLSKTHQYYVDYQLPKIESLLSDLIQSCGKDCQELNIINSFYQKYKQELIVHIKDEEVNVFPYVLKLVNEGKKHNDYSIQSFEKEHTNVDNKLNDLKNLLIKYIQPNYNDDICNEFLQSLASFEKDIQDHARIEDLILVPQIVEMEEEIDNV